MPSLAPPPSVAPPPSASPEPSLGRKLFWLFVAIAGFYLGFEVARALAAEHPVWLLWTIAIGAGPSDYPAIGSVVGLAVFLVILVLVVV